MANEELNAIKALIQELTIEIRIGEERLGNKIDHTEFLKKTQKIKDALVAKIDSVDKRVTNLYIKVIGTASVISAGVASLAKLFL